jgi:polyisoprenoid-binding protein YceI
LDERDLAGSYAEGTIEAASVDTHEPNRDAHLKSADFFDAERFPQLKFRSTGASRLGEGHLRVSGLLTIRDVTREVVLDVHEEGRSKDPWGNLRWGFTATTAINRKDYGLNWNVALEAGGWLVGDQVKINIDLELIYQPDQQVVQPELEKATA